METTEPNPEREIMTSRTLNAAPETIFKAITTPELLAKWWGPKGFTNTFEEISIVPGGNWRFVMHGPDGGNYKNESIFEEITAPEKIVINHISNPKFWLTITLVPSEGKTLLTWTMLFLNAADLAKVKHIVVEANEENLDRLEEVLVQTI